MKETKGKYGIYKRKKERNTEKKKETTMEIEKQKNKEKIKEIKTNKERKRKTQQLFLTTFARCTK